MMQHPYNGLLHPPIPAARMKMLITFIIFGSCIVFAASIVITLLKPAGRDGQFRARRLMTDNEAEFFGRLIVALPEHYVFPQVAMSALLQSSAGTARQAHSDRLRIAQQRVDYVVCDRECQVVAVVELDDRTHSAAKDKLRDGRLLQGGIRTVRFQSKSKPLPAAIRDAVILREEAVVI